MSGDREIKVSEHTMRIISSTASSDAKTCLPGHWVMPKRLYENPEVAQTLVCVGWETEQAEACSTNFNPIEELFMSLATTPSNDENRSQAGRLCHIL